MDVVLGDVGKFPGTIFADMVWDGRGYLLSWWQPMNEVNSIDKSKHRMVPWEGL